MKRLPDPVRQTGPFVLPCVLPLLLMAIAAQAAVGNAAEKVLFDFDKQKLAPRWSAVGSLRAERKAVPPFQAEDKRRPGGSGLIISATAKSGIFSKIRVAPKDWRGFGALSFWVHRSAEESREHPRTVIEVQCYEVKGAARFWRKVEVDHTGWKRITLPLIWFRWGSRGRVPRWDRIAHFGFWFREPSRLVIDRVSVDLAEKPEAAYLSPQILSPIAFPDRSKDIRLLENDQHAILSNAERLDMPRLSGHLRNVGDAFAKDFPFLAARSRKPMLIVFANREQYDRFAPRLAKQFNSTGGAPRLGGFTMQGVATSYWLATYGTLRPVYTHEFIHSLLTATECLPNRGEWLHEGAAGRMQLRFHPQKNFADIVRLGLNSRRYRADFRQLCNGEAISHARYWQATTIVSLLVDDKKYRPRLPELFKAFHARGSTRLEPVLKTVLKTTWAELETDWRAFCQRRYLNAGRVKESP